MYDVKVINDEMQGPVHVIYVETCPEVCSQKIGVAVIDGIILEAGFVGGCSGNTQGLGALIKGMKVQDAIARLEGIKCGDKPTSCPDQLAKALKLFL